MPKFNREDLAWAAGFFDGEGSTELCKRNSKNGYIQKTLRMEIGQVADNKEVLYRFKSCVREIGKIYDPYQPKNKNNRPTMKWSISSFKDCQTVIAMLWPWLSSTKRIQAKQAITECVEHFRKPRVLSIQPYLSTEKVSKIREIYSKGDVTHKELGLKYNVSGATIRRVINKIGRSYAI